MSRGGEEPGVLLQRLVKHQVRKHGGNAEMITKHYRSGLALLASMQQNKVSVKEDSVGDRIVKQLVREGRQQDAVNISSLLSSLRQSGTHILRNRAAILTFLHSLSERRDIQIQAFSTPLHHKYPSHSSGFSSISTIHPPAASSNISLHPSSTMSASHTFTTNSTNQQRPSTTKPQDSYHPPVPPKPRSRPNSVVLNGTEVDGSGKTPQSQSTFSTGVGTIPSVFPGPPQTSELDLVKELVYVFQGIEGKIIRRDPATFKYYLGRETIVTPAQASITLKLCELGWLFSKIEQFTERQGAETEYGLVGQSFVTAIREELTEYYRLISVLEAQVRDGSLTLLQLSVWASEPMKRLKLLVELVSAAGSSRGGSLASCIYAFINQGDPGLEACVTTLLTAACRPLYTMLIRWILDGSLEDPHNEFFIASEPGVQGESLWHHKYSIRKTMIPRFISLPWSRKILSTGKSINFLRSVCMDNSPLLGRQKIISRLEETDPASLFSCDVDNPLLEVAGDAFRQTGQHVLDIMFKKFKLMSHLAALRKYLLLGQGDIMRYLLDLLETELSQPASQLYPHNLAGILETAIRATNTQFEDSDILERLDVRLLEVQPGDSGWDVFSLDYKVSGPIGVVFTPDTMTRYLMLFNTLWRAKRMEWVLSGVWKKLAYLHKICREINEVSPVLHQANLLACEMIHFVHQMAYYITFEVMECGWDLLVKQIDTAETLEDVIQAHEEFLSTLVSRALLDEKSIDIRNQLRTIYDRILEFQNIQEKLYQDTVAELEARHTMDELIRLRTQSGEYGTYEEEQIKDADRRKDFVKCKLAGAKANLRIVSLSYQDMVRTFLFQLTSSNDQSLQCLSFRLDFNQHYKRKDSRLSRPLTFSHRRMSGMNSLTGSQISYLE